MDRLEQSIEESRQWRKSMEEDHQKWRNAMEEDHQRWRLEMEESHQENKQGLKELRNIVTANQEESQKWRKSMEEDRRESKKELKELRKTIADSRKEREEDRRENQKELKELRKTIADSRKELGQISHRLGTIVEDLVAPSLPRVLKEMVNCPTEQDILINVRVRRRHPTQKGKMLEIDAMADCGNYVLFNETKSQFSPEKVKAFLAKLAVVRDYFPEYQHHQIRGCIASLYLDKSLIDYASRQGLLALASGEFLMTVQNEAGFLWKAF
jgi:anion-transporting  ArsA/GET3 family ATPase